MYKVTMKDKNGKEHGIPFYTDNWDEAMFTYGFLANTSVYNKNYVERDKETGKKKTVVLEMERKIYKLDSIGTATDVTPADESPTERALLNGLSGN